MLSYENLVNDLVVQDPDTCGGKPRIKGTRLSIQLLKDNFDDMGEEDFRSEWEEIFQKYQPSLPMDDIITLLKQWTL